MLAEVHAQCCRGGGGGEGEQLISGECGAVDRSDYMFPAGHTTNFCPFSVEISSKEENSARFVQFTLTTPNYKIGSQ